MFHDAANGGKVIGSKTIAVDWLPAPGARPGPRKIAAVGNVYTLTDGETEMHVDVLYGTKYLPIRLLKAALTAAPKKYIMDTRNPKDTTVRNNDGDDRFIGFSASIAGNAVTLDSGTFQGTIDAVYGIS